LKLSKKNRPSIADYSNETEELTIKSLMGNGFTANEASAYLNKLMIQRLSENDNDCRNDVYNPDLMIPADRMYRFADKRGKK